jgi:hypothetical protein
MDKYIWRKDGTQLRISYIKERGGVEVVNGNGDTLRERDCVNAKQAKKIINDFVVEFEGK